MQGGGTVPEASGAERGQKILWSFWSLFSLFFLFFFRDDFLLVFWSFWGAKMGRFWSQKSINVRLMSFCFLLIFYWFFHYFCVLGGLMLVLYLFFFRILFCIDF